MNPKTAAAWIAAHQWLEAYKHANPPRILAQEAEKRFRVAIRQAKPVRPRLRLPKALKIKTPQAIKKDLKKELEALCKAIVFTRDCGGPDNRAGNCITCGKFTTLQWGHFVRQQDSKWLQYDPRNTAGQCAGCNGPGGRGRPLEFALAIDKREGKGVAAALHLEAKNNQWWRPNKGNLTAMLRGIGNRYGRPDAVLGEAYPGEPSDPHAPR